MSEARVRRVAAPLRQQVVGELRESILAARFEPGTRLVEKVLCERYEVSRTVVREALRQLEAEGLVRIVANRGPVVATLSPQEAASLYEVRGALEALAGSLFAQRATDEQCAALQQALQRVRDTVGKRGSARETGPAGTGSAGTGPAEADSGSTAAGGEPGMTELLNAKDAFYDTLVDGAHNPEIRATLRTVHARVQMLRGLSLRSSGRAPHTERELAEITRAAAVDRDADRAWRACDRHVRAAAEVALAQLSASR